MEVHFCCESFCGFLVTELIRAYMEGSVLEGARERISLVFDHFERVVVSVSSGKDSTALYWLSVQEALKRGRKVDAFFLDQEAEYESSVRLIESMMRHPNVRPLWYQVPLQLTNATSYQEDMFNAWEEGESWMREKHPLAIQVINEEYPKRFYSFFKWMEKTSPGTAFLIGLRTEESLNRLRAVMKHPGWKDVRWSTKTKGKDTYRFYPIYSWGMGDVWKFIADGDFPYNAIYDKMYWHNRNFYRTMRVSNLIHEKSFKCLSDLQVYEPETYDRLVRRLSGVHISSLYAQESTVFSTGALPKKFKTWLEYRDYLLETTPLKKKTAFLNRFEHQPKDEDMYKRQVRQVLLNDYENNLKVDSHNQKKTKEDLMKWWGVL